MKRLFILLILGMCISGCGYRLGSPSLVNGYETFHVAYAKGDDRGIFTASVIERIATNTPLKYVNEGADLEIMICLSAPTQRNIGFIYAPKNPKVTTANEGRLTQIATLSITDCKRRCRVLNAQKIMVSLDYDFQSDMTTINEHAFSLGQLEMNPLAKDAATPALYGLLAEKIVDYVKNSW